MRRLSNPSLDFPRRAATFCKKSAAFSGCAGASEKNELFCCFCTQLVAQLDDASAPATVASVMQRAATWIEMHLSLESIASMRAATSAQRLTAVTPPVAPQVEFGISSSTCSRCSFPSVCRLKRNGLPPGWIPAFAGAARIESPTTLLPGACFQSTAVRVENFSQGGANLVFSIANASEPVCSDMCTWLNRACWRIVCPLLNS